MLNQTGRSVLLKDTKTINLLGMPVARLRRSNLIGLSVFLLTRAAFGGGSSNSEPIYESSEISTKLAENKLIVSTFTAKSTAMQATV